MGSTSFTRTDAVWITLVLGGLSLSFAAYYYPPYPFNPLETVASVAFWVGLFLLLKRIFLGEAVSLASRAFRTLEGASIGVLYIFVHLLLYGFILEGIFAFIYQAPPAATSTSFYASSSMFYPVSAVNAVVGLTFSPNVTVVVPPIFGASLSSFSIFVAVIIDLLIVANIAKVNEIGGVAAGTARTKAYVAMPLIGIVAGASCCMSLPSLLTIAAPAIVTLPSFIWAYYVSYFGFPLFAAVLLKTNLDVASKIASVVSLQNPVTQVMPEGGKL